jgi:hypothetical protein
MSDVSPVDRLTVKDVEKLPSFIGRSIFSEGIKKDPKGFIDKLKKDEHLQDRMSFHRDLSDLPKMIAKNDIKSVAGFIKWRIEIGK